MEDDQLISGPLAVRLRDSGYEVWVANNGRDGLALAVNETPDVVVLDVMMPEMDGWEVCQVLRARSSVPILMLTALGDEVDRILGLELGADDYLAKPFSVRELIARIRALSRRVRLDKEDPPVDSRLVAGPIVLDLNTRRVFKRDRELALRFKEFELLTLLMNREGVVVTRAELFDQICGTDWLGDTRTLDVHVRWLREKIEDDPSHPRHIQTVRGVGYRFISQEEGA